MALKVNLAGEITKNSPGKKASLKRRVAIWEQIMSSLYTKRGWYYLSIMRNGKRAIRAIGTKNYRIAQKLRPTLEYEMLKEIHFPQKKKHLAFPELVKIYLKSNPH